MTTAAATVLKGCVHTYRYTLRAIIGAHCRHYPTCSDYALEALDAGNADEAKASIGRAEQALSAGSAFQGELAKLRRCMHTVTIHVYGDSFDAFRKIRKDLYHLGFAVAARPLAPEMTIGFSPTGSKSTSQ